MKLQTFDYKQISTRNFINRVDIKSGDQPSGSVVKVQVLGMEVPGLNSGKFFFQHFLHTFFTTL